MINAFRLCKSKYADKAFTGDGARLHGGRWNSPGFPVVYTSASLSLATLEILVHLEDAEVFLRFFSWFSVKIPKRLIEEISLADLPGNWAAEEIPGSTRKIGNRWFASERSAVLAVPSVITPGERNYLLNPHHHQFSKITVSEPRDFSPDRRLFHRFG